MPVLNGKRVSLDEWRAAHAPAEAAADEADAAVEAPIEKPKRQRRTKKDVAAQVMAAMGIAPEAVITEPEAPAATESEAAIEVEADATEEVTE